MQCKKSCFLVFSATKLKKVAEVGKSETRQKEAKTKETRT
jgi:hypothetical protein